LDAGHPDRDNAGMATKRVTVNVGGRELQVSNLDKVLYPEAGFTKRDVIDYLARIAPVMLPHLHERPLSLKRYPDGVDGMFFYEKRCPMHRPDWVCTRRVVLGTAGPIDFCIAHDVATLAWLGNIAALELHTHLYRVSDDHRPTMLVFDLDPGAPAGLRECLDIALLMRERLSNAGLDSWAKTSGGKGLHLYVPLNTAVDFAATKTFARAFAESLSRELPDRVTSVMSKAERPGKIFIDWSQNDRAKTTASAYTLRARAQPTVSTPVTWDEIAAARKRWREGRLSFLASDVIKRVERDGDLFAEVLTTRQKLPSPDAVTDQAASPTAVRR
jgi:bifunctional non-homologous end joining protein LigD